MKVEKAENKEQLIGLGLISGGLDSLTACLLLQKQGIKVIGLNFSSPFCQYDKNSNKSECNLGLFHEKLGIEVYNSTLEDDYLELIRNPKFGYGKNLNPCIDCRIYILNKAKEFMKKVNADFIFTGEVLNQRPKSQHMKALKIVERESGLERKLLRPLSALHLKPTIYEEKGLIDRQKLLGIKGRSRKIQLEIAREYGLLENYYACGGCLLTDVNFANRVRDYMKFNDNPIMQDIHILKYGRHFRFKNIKIIIGRNENENKILLDLKKSNDLIMEAKDVPGPVTIVQGEIYEEILNFAAKLTVRYSDYNELRGLIIYGYNYDHLDNEIFSVIKKGEDLRNYIL
ncbi:MAG: tRNA 4-thiouridine(8) synthase ThiI [Promethearchaeota archaeon]